MAKVTHERQSNGRTILWTVPRACLQERSFSQIMMDHGYHPAGYGQPFDETEDEENFYFKCWASSD